MQQALAKLWDEGIRMTVVGGVSYEVDTLSIQLSKVVDRSVIWKLQSRGDLRNAVADIDMIPSNVVVLNITATPCERISRGTMYGTDNTVLIGPHAPPSNLCFATHEVLVRS